MNKTALASELELVLGYSEDNYLPLNAKFFAHALFENLQPQQSRLALATYYMRLGYYHQVIELLADSNANFEKYVLAVAHYRLGNLEEAKKSLVLKPLSAKFLNYLFNGETENLDVNISGNVHKNMGEAFADRSNLFEEKVIQDEKEVSQRQRYFCFNSNSSLPGISKPKSRARIDVDCGSTPGAKEKNLMQENYELEGRTKIKDIAIEDAVANGAAGLYYLGHIYEAEGKLDTALKCFKWSYNANPKIFHAFIKFTELNAKIFFNQNSSTAKKVTNWLSRTEKAQNSRSKFPKTFYTPYSGVKAKNYLLQGFEEENLLTKRVKESLAEPVTPGKQTRQAKQAPDSVTSKRKKIKTQTECEFDAKSFVTPKNKSGKVNTTQNLQVVEAEKELPIFEPRYQLRTPRNSTKSNSEVFQTFSNLRNLKSQSSIEGSQNPFIKVQADIAISPFEPKRSKQSITKTKALKASGHSFIFNNGLDDEDTMRPIAPCLKSSIKENNCLPDIQFERSKESKEQAESETKLSKQPAKSTRRKLTDAANTQATTLLSQPLFDARQIETIDTSYQIYYYLKKFKPGIVAFYMRDFQSIADEFASDQAFAFELSPLNSSFANVTIGKSYMNVMQYDEAEKYFETAFRMNELSQEGLEHFSSCLWYLKKSARLLELSVFCENKFPKSPCSYVVRGNCFSLMQDHQNAIENFKKAIKHDSENSYALCLLGHEYVFIEDFDKATKAYTKAIEKDSLQFYAFWGLGNIHLKTEKTAPAMSYFYRALLLNPMCPLLYTYIGITYLNMKRNKEALLYFKKSESLNSNSLMNSFYKATAWYNEQQWEEAAEELEKLKIKATTEAKVYVLLGKIYQKTGRNDLAHTNFVNALDLDPKDSQGKIRNLIEMLNADRPGMPLNFLLETPRTEK